ncbi:MAG: DUF1049 domain-containing protein [Defluviimonas sp.]|nr:DUF1049 domain-containing protein [Defluviimonas sp.]
MRFLRILFLAVLGIALVAIASANRAPVTLHLLPDELGALLGFDRSVEMPLFIAVFGGVLVGLGLGFVWEWAREGKHRAAASEHRREAGRLQREVKKLRTDTAQPEDEVLALLEGKGAAR